MTDLEPTRFVRLPDAEKKNWRRPKSFGFARHLSQVELSDTELLLTSHYLPIAIDSVEDRLQVVALIKPQLQHAPIIGPEGQWRKGYVPIALRCVPFRAIAGNSDAERLEIALNLEEAEGEALPIFAADGSLASEVNRIARLLDRLERGKRLLQKAAETLFIVGVLSPLQLARLNGAEVASSRVLTVDRNKLEALSSSRTAHLVKDSFLPMDLAAACIFSQRLMSSLVSVETAPEPTADLKAVTGPREGVLTGLPPPAQVDSSQLFSFELFDEVTRKSQHLE